MSLYDILACPNCKIHVIREENTLSCPKCEQIYPIINNIPVIFPDGSIPEVHHQAELLTRQSYDPWIHRVILQSLLDDQIALDVGSGNMELDDPNVIRMDLKLSPHVDLVADVHALPFLPGSVDYIFSLAVIEHLRNPFQAAQSIYETLKDGGYIYHECNFVFAYHGYPHHYFNASLQGMEQVFAQFVHLKKGVAPYQMPSFTLDNVVHTYLQRSQCRNYPHGKRLGNLLEQILAINAMDFDIYFTEEDALYVAAGTYISGVKQETSASTLIPAPIKQIWQNDQALQIRFPKLNDLSTVENILHWAQKEGRNAHSEIAYYLDTLIPFNKRGKNAPSDRSTIQGFPFAEPKFGAIGYDPDQPLDEKAQIAEARLQASEAEKKIEGDDGGLIQKSLVTIRREGLRSFLSKTLLYLGYKLQRN